MMDASGLGGLPQPVHQLKVTARIGGGDMVGTGLRQTPEFTVKELGGLLGLSDVVDTGGAATPAAFRKFSQPDAGEGIEQLPGLPGDLLSVAEMAAFVVGKVRCPGKRTRRRRAKADFDQPFMNILCLLVPLPGTCGIGRISSQ